MPLVRRSGSRALVTALLALLGLASVTLVAPDAQAQSTASQTAQLRAEADALSKSYFVSLARVRSLDDDIARSEQLIEQLLARAEAARTAARARALLAYTSSGTQLSTLVQSSDTLETARRAHLIDRVNAHDEDVYAQLTRATRALHKQQRDLRATRDAQADALDGLRAQGAAIDAKLAQAEAQERQAQALAAVATTPPVSSSTTGAPAAAAPAAASTTNTTAAPRSAPTPPPTYSGTPGVNPHHDDPFLTCVRQRESGGNYSAVNPAGPYMGAYQFLQSTWNATANHAGRRDLVGVPPNVATPYDQDEIAWVLYQWQGKDPWGGGC